MNLSEKINHYLSFFEYKKRGDDMITIFTDNAPDDLRESVRNAHDDRLPNDWIFNKYQSILDAFNQYDINSIEDLSDNRAEIVDSLVDIYTADLTAWLASDVNNVYYITESQEEYGAETDGFKILQIAQYKAIDKIYDYVITLLANEETEKGGE